MGVVVANETDSNTKFNKQRSDYSGLDIDSVNFLYHDVMVSSQIFIYPTLGYEFCDVALDSAYCVDITNKPMGHSCTSGIVNTTLPKHLAAFRNGNIIGLDTLSQISIFKPNLMLSTQGCLPVVVSGVSKADTPITITNRGTSVIGLDTYISDQSVGNILSFAEARDNSYSLDWNHKEDRFELQVFEGGETYMFSRHADSENLYLCDLRDAVVYVTTVKENKKFYSKREKVMAIKARVLQW